MPLASQVNTGLSFLSQYPIDKIVTKTPFIGSFSCSGFNNSTFDPGTGSTVITHNIGTKCLPELLYSTDNVNFIPAPQANSNGLAAVASCGPTTCTLYAYQGIGTTTVTVYYILYLVWPN